MNAPMPLAPLRSSGVSVRAIVMTTPACVPLETHAFVPLRTQQSPSGVACVRSDAASDPLSGSDSASEARDLHVTLALNCRFLAALGMTVNKRKNHVPTFSQANRLQRTS